MRVRPVNAKGGKPAGQLQPEHTLPQRTDKEAAHDENQENDQKPDSEREGTAQAAPLSH
ncbi:hypothetical protein ES708_26964 [subsurface metagenome]